MHDSIVLLSRRPGEIRRFVSALVGLVHGLGCEAVAEGVETQAQVDVLGWGVIQSYAVVKPTASDAR